MELLIIILILLFIFCFGLLFPTMLFLSDERKKKKVETLIKFCLISTFFILLAALFALFYDSYTVLEDTTCSFIGNYNCLFANTLPKKIVPNAHIIFVFLLQLIAIFTYSYYTAKKVMEYSSKQRAIMQLVIFFLVGVVSSIIHYFVLYDVAFVGELQYISMISANQYGLLPLIYLIIMTVINRDQLKFK